MANTAQKAINAALKEVGYLEKKSNLQLDSKTANAGSANYTKYGKWYGLNPDLWCAMFLCWVFDTAYGSNDAKNYCAENSQQHAKKSARILFPKISILHQIHRPETLYFSKEAGMREQTTSDLLLIPQTERSALLKEILLVAVPSSTMEAA